MRKFIVECAKHIAILALLVAGIGIAHAWTGPTAPPPGNNIESPINTSSIVQTKSGSLYLGAGNPAVSLRTLAGKAAFGTSSPIASNLLVFISGNVGADNYCDGAGNNCHPASEFSKVHYFTDSPFLSRFGGSEFTNNTSTTFLEKTVTFTESEIRAYYGIPSTTNIKGILVDYNATYYHSSGANNGYYRIEVENTEYGDYSASKKFHLVHYDEPNRRDLNDANLPIVDFNDDGNFNIKFTLTRATPAALPSGMYLAETVVVTGYITE